MLNLEPASNAPPIPSHISHLNQLMRGHPAVPEAGARASTIPSSTQETMATAATSMSSSFSSTTTATKDKTTGKAEGGKNSADGAKTSSQMPKDLSAPPKGKETSPVKATRAVGSDTVQSSATNTATTTTASVSTTSNGGAGFVAGNSPAPRGEAFGIVPAAGFSSAGFGSNGAPVAQGHAVMPNSSGGMAAAAPVWPPPPSAYDQLLTHPPGMLPGLPQLWGGNGGGDSATTAGALVALCPAASMLSLAVATAANQSSQL